MALLESRLTRKCCRKPRFDCQYNDDLKQFVCSISLSIVFHHFHVFIVFWYILNDEQITRKSLASDLKDISETFHANQPSVCFYNALPIIMVLADIALCITRWVYINTLHHYLTSVQYFNTVHLSPTSSLKSNQIINVSHAPCCYSDRLRANPMDSCAVPAISDRGDVLLDLVLRETVFQTKMEEKRLRIRWTH